MALLESTAFDAATGVASDLDTLLKASSGATLAEIMKIAERPAGQLMLAQRVLELVEKDFDPRFMNPADTAVTLYLWVLANTRRSLAEGVAAAALGLGNGWWAPRMCRRILAADSRSFAPPVSVTWLPVAAATTVNLESEPRDEVSISAHGIAQHVRDATALVNGSITFARAENITVTYNVGFSDAFKFAGVAETVNDNLALAA
jgi:hypothetical protein